MKPVRTTGRKQICFWGKIGMILLLFFMWDFPAVQAQKKRVVRIAYPIQAGLTQIDEDGKMSGYTYEYLQEIAQYTGWEYEFVIGSNSDEDLLALMDQVAEGSIDLMGGMMYSESMKERYDYSAYSYGMVETVLQVAAEDTRDIVIDSRIEQDLTVAVHENSVARKNEFLEFCEINKVNPRFVYYTDYADVRALLQNNEVDAVLKTSADRVEGLRTIARFAPKPYYFIASKKDDSGLIKELNYALQSIEQSDPYFSTRLEEKYFGNLTNRLVLSDSEKAYIDKTQSVRVGYLRDYPPLEFEDQGQPAGIAVDYLRSISEKTGLAFEFVPADSTAQLDQMAAAGEVEMIAGMTYDYDSAQQRNLGMTRVYLNSQYVAVLNKSIDETDLSGKVMAISENSWFAGSEDTSLTRAYASMQDCMESVYDGKTDYTIADGYAAQYYLNQPKYNNLRLIPLTAQTHEICFGVANRGNQELLTILNKVILATSDEEAQSLIYKNTVFHHTMTLTDFIRENSLTAVTLISGVGLFIIAVLAYAGHQRSKMNREISLELKKHLQVYQLVNDMFFEFDIKTQKLMIFDPAAGQKGEAAQVRELPQQDFRCAKIKQEIARLLKMESGGKAIREITLNDPQQQPHWFRIAMQTITDESGRCVYVIGRLNNIDEQVKEKERLRLKAERDSLTHILNAETSRKQVEAELEARPQAGALILLDIDHFKEVNDTYGHWAGDQVLGQVAQLLQEVFSGEIVGRPGGDEFLVYIRQSEPENVRQRCEDLRRRIQEIRLSATDRLSISAGCAGASADSTFETLYQQADKALYQAKEKGRNQIVYAFQPATSAGEDAAQK